jgi:4-amino-4-deoxy-L-arabinose transferase-like glycosyltransferase
VPDLSKLLLSNRGFKLAVVLAFFFLLGTRGLNEPDEGRYAEIGREMVETGDWLVPKIWYVPHLDKPPMTYWAVGASIAAFGLNEWAIRLPIALSGLSGAWAIYLLGLSIGGRRVARWAVLILSSSLLYFAIARMVMTDMILLQFICWAIYFGWRAWRALDPPEPAELIQEGESEDPDFTSAQLAGGRGARMSFAWQLAAWVMLAGGFLTKGPLVFLIPAFAFIPLFIYARRVGKFAPLFLGVVPGLTLFALLALPWYLMLFEQIAHAFDYMVKGQVVGHALKAAAKNRGGPIVYYLPILLFGFLPWTPLLGWLWRRSHWITLDQRQKEAFVMLTGWAVLTFLFFSINSAKLPHYIVPMMPALALLVAFRWPDWRDAETLPRAAWQAVIVSPFVAMLAIPFAYRFAFKIADQRWIWVQAGIALIVGTVVCLRSRETPAPRLAANAIAASLLNLFLLVGLMPLVESNFRSNQSLRELGQAVRDNWTDNTQLVVCTRIPQGLPLYTWPLINQTNRPWFYNLPRHRMPYAYPGNEDRLAPHTLETITDITALASTNRVLAVGWVGAFSGLANTLTNSPPKMITVSGHWELFTIPGQSGAN